MSSLQPDSDHHSKRSPHERRRSDVSDLRKLTMAELENTRVLRKCGILFASTTRIALRPSGLRLLIDLRRPVAAPPYVLSIFRT
jgi:hypothetical protein